MKLKSGIKTSEFWITLLPTVIATLVLTGVIEEGDTDLVVGLAKDIVAGIVAVASIVTYIVNRSGLKKEIVRSSVLNNNLLETEISKESESEIG